MLHNKCYKTGSSKLRSVGYILGLAFPMMAVFGLWTGGWSTVLFPLAAFGLVPLVELFVDGRGSHNSDLNVQHRVLHDLVLMMGFFMAWLGWFLLMIQFSQTGLGVMDVAGMILCAGILFGALGINTAHEMGHRREKIFQNLSKVLLILPLYMHFYIEHNRGHHRRMATPEDPATARRGETVYAFMFRSVVFGWLSAWSIEAHRLRGKGTMVHILHNQMLHFQLIQVSAVTAVAVLLGGSVAVAWVGAAVVGFLLLEAVNYVEHYGLVRQKLPNGKYERVSPRHSWNSDHPISRALLLELPRHADHHAYPARPYGALRHFSDSHQLPTGYSGMVLLSLVPPLFFRVMDRQLESERQRLAA
jgi:alkane 1-monooxygenase